MVTHTIEELHELFKSGELDVKEYYKELFEEAKETAGKTECLCNYY